jgi:HK97 family phage prohead protease
MTEPDFVTNISNLDDWRQQAANGTASRDTVLRKQFISDVEVRDDRTVKFVITTGDADREKDVIDPSGWDVENYLKNPVVLFAHDYDSLPVARTTSLEQQGDKLIAVAEFASAELNPMAERVFQMLKQGFLRGASVGFRPTSFAFNEARGGVDFAKQELLEFSIVPIPANAQALMAAGLSDDDTTLLTDWAKDVLARLDPSALLLPDGTSADLTAKMIDSEQLNDFLDVIREKMNNIKVSVREAIGSVDEFQNAESYHDDDNTEETASRTVAPDVVRGISPRNVSEQTAPMDESWSRPTLGDFSGEPWEDLSTGERRKIAGHFAWATTAVPDAFGDMKLPHHRASDGYVVWRGVVAAAGRLDQTAFPSEDMGAVKQHLASHFKEFDREAPWERDASSWSAFVKARDRREYKTSSPLHDDELAELLDDYGFSNEAVALVTTRPTKATDGHRYQQVVLDTLERIETGLSNRVTLLEDDVVVLELDDEVARHEKESTDDDLLVDVDPNELASALRLAVQESVSTVVGAEMRSAINAARGRLD